MEIYLYYRYIRRAKIIININVNHLCLKSYIIKEVIDFLLIVFIFVWLTFFILALLSLDHGVLNLNLEKQTFYI